MFYILISLDLMFLFICLFIVLCLYSFIWFPFFYLFPTTHFLCNCIYIYLFFYFSIHLFLSLYFTFIRYWFWCFVWFVSLLQVGIGLCCLFPSVSFFRSFLFCFGKSGEADRCCQGWLFDFCLCLRLSFSVWGLSCSLFFCEHSVLLCICLVFRLLWFI